MPGGKPYPLETLPAPMDVVWAHFPYDEASDRPGPPHPCLVFKRAVVQSAGVGAVKVAFGTSNIQRESRDLNLVVSNYNALRMAGLHKETLFDLGRSKWLWWTDEWFSSPDPRRWSTPRIGCIEQLGQDVLRSIIATRAQWGMDCP